MKTYREMADELFARREEYQKERARKRRTALGVGAAFAAVIAVVGLVLAVRGLTKGPHNAAAHNSTPPPGMQSSADPTAFAGPTDDHGLYPDETPSETQVLPRETVEPDPTGIPGSTVFVSQHTAYVSAAHAVLGGGTASPGFTLDGGAVFFGMGDGVLTAYARALYFDDPGDVRYRLFDPIASFPAELGERARRSIADGIRENKDPNFTGDDSLQLFGFMGEGYVIFFDEQFHGRQVSAIFVNDGGSEWRELKPNAVCSAELTGGCILPDGTGFLCYFDRDALAYEDRLRKLTVFRTADGGETWTDIGLWIPEEYEGRIGPPCAALSPVFEGSRGVMLVTYSSYGEDGVTQHSISFESLDGGESWTLVPDRSDI